MGKEDWIKAARKFELAPEPPLTPEQKEWIKFQHAREQACHDLDRFLHSDEGRAAMRLLRASKKRIVLLVRKGEKTKVTKYLDGEGLRSLFEDQATRQEREAAPHEAFDGPSLLDEYVQDDGGILRWLYQQLDAIARSVPKP